jgi:tRNA(Arg) A34 adenosine deaminase TadA
METAALSRRTTLLPVSPNDLSVCSTHHTAVTDPNFDDFDHDSHMRRAFELAHEAADRGDRPFGSVLVRDDTIIMTDSNHVLTANDIRRHPELHLAYRACRELDPNARAETAMYTSTEPCPMCAGGMVTAGFGRIVYSVSSDEIAEFTGNKTSVRSAEILDGVSDVVGPVLNDEGRQIHDEFDW